MGWGRAGTGPAPPPPRRTCQAPQVEQAEGVEGGAELQAAGKPAPKLILQLKKVGEALNYIG